MSQLADFEPAAFKRDWARRIAGNVKTLRVMNGLTETQLASRSFTTVETVRSIEAGLIFPSVEVIYFLSVSLGVDMSDLFLRDPEKIGRNTKYENGKPGPIQNAGH